MSVTPSLSLYFFLPLSMSLSLFLFRRRHLFPTRPAIARNANLDSIGRISGLCCRKKGGKAAERSGGRGSRPCLTFALARARQIDQRAPQQVRGRRTDNSSTAATFAPFSLLCRVPTPDAAADVSLSLDGLLNGLPPPRPSSVLLRLWRRNGDETKNAVDVGKAQDLL